MSQFFIHNENTLRARLENYFATLFLRVASLIYETTGRGKQHFDICDFLQKLWRKLVFLHQKVLQKNFPIFRTCTEQSMFSKLLDQTNIKDEVYSKTWIFSMKIIVFRKIRHNRHFFGTLATNVFLPKHCLSIYGIDSTLGLFENANYAHQYARYDELLEIRLFTNFDPPCLETYDNFSTPRRKFFCMCVVHNYYPSHKSFGQTRVVTCGAIKEELQRIAEN